jgi:hypothetical protein
VVKAYLGIMFAASVRALSDGHDFIRWYAFARCAPALIIWAFTGWIILMVVFMKHRHRRRHLLFILHLIRDKVIEEELQKLLL